MATRRETVRVAARCARREVLPGKRRPIEAWVEVFAREGTEVAPSPPEAFVVGVILDGASAEGPADSAARRGTEPEPRLSPDVTLRVAVAAGSRGRGTIGEIEAALRAGEGFLRQRSLGALWAIRELTALAARRPLREALSAERARFPHFFAHRDRLLGIDAFLHRRVADFADPGAIVAVSHAGTAPVLPKKKRAAR